jgi:hypothetical protein
MAFTTNLYLEAPAWKTLRFDEALNDDLDIIDAAVFGFPGSSAPGTVGNHPDVTVSEGCPWRDTGNHESKVRGYLGWETFLSAAAPDEVNASGSEDLTDWCDLIGATDACDPRYAIPVKIGGTTYYIPVFTSK